MPFKIQCHHALALNASTVRCVNKVQTRRHRTRDNDAENMHCGVLGQKYCYTTIAISYHHARDILMQQLMFTCLLYVVILVHPSSYYLFLVYILHDSVTDSLWCASATKLKLCVHKSFYTSNTMAADYRVLTLPENQRPWYRSSSANRSQHQKGWIVYFLTFTLHASAQVATAIATIACRIYITEMHLNIATVDVRCTRIGHLQLQGQH